MKQYDSIEYFGEHLGIPTIAFDKIDGSNIRAEFSQKRGFYKFGTRKMMIDKSSEPFGFAIDLFLNKYSDGLTEVFKNKEYRNSLAFVCFAELVGTKSAFGQHEFGNDTFDITLIDVDQYKRGQIPPKEFIKNFEHLGIPRIVYEGNLNKELVSSIKRNDFNLTEGVVCKSVIENKKGRESIYSCKIKTDDWFSRLREKYPREWEEEQKQVKKDVE